MCYILYIIYYIYYIHIHLKQKQKTSHKNPIGLQVLHRQHLQSNLQSLVFCFNFSKFPNFWAYFEELFPIYLNPSKILFAIHKG